MSTLQPLPYVLTGVASLLGRIISINEWAELARVPNRKGPGFLDGSVVERLLGRQMGPLGRDLVALAASVPK